MPALPSAWIAVPARSGPPLMAHVPHVQVVFIAVPKIIRPRARNAGKGLKHRPRGPFHARPASRENLAALAASAPPARPANIKSSKAKASAPTVT